MIIHNIIALAEQLKVAVLAEGVEKAEQLAYLREVRCDEVQGFYFHRAMPREELEKLVMPDRQETGSLPVS